ncbi:MAG: CPBP family intramembrane metalloprotease [Anaerolineae bacterium]|nr:CPBP family intramembrane metalloprotease [Anaerolineae bacterium]
MNLSKQMAITIRRFADGMDNRELENPTLETLAKVIWHSLRTFRVERAALIIGSAFVLLMLWGTHGRVELLSLVWPDWRGPGVDIASRPTLIPGVPWDNEMISFLVGAFLVVAIPIGLIKGVYKQSLSDYGLGLPPQNRRRFALLSFVALTLIAAPAFYLGSRDPAMRAVYPFYRPFDSIGSFVAYEFAYLPFFIAIEFIFRGYLLFGLAGIRDDEVQVHGRQGITAMRMQDVVVKKTAADSGLPGAFYFDRYALLIQMLSYTAWHLGKPLPELWGTLVWGLAAGSVAYTARSIWPVILSHWLLNVFMDALIAGPF